MPTKLSSAPDFKTIPEIEDAARTVVTMQLDMAKEHEALGLLQFTYEQVKMNLVVSNPKNEAHYLKQHIAACLVRLHTLQQ